MSNGRELPKQRGVQGDWGCESKEFAAPTKKIHFIMDAPETSNAPINKSQRKNSQKSNKQDREQQSESHSLQKRPVSKPFQRKSDIYVSNKSNFQVKTIKKKLESKENDLK